MTERYAMIAAATGLSLAALALPGCGEQTPEAARDASIARCERQFGQMASDAARGTALCTCIVDDLAEEGLEVTDMLGADRARVEEVSRACAREAGVTLP